jgi:mannose-1-phosphate guanylyltransferase
MKFIPVIMSGGAGTRLWPVSREHHPKPFIKLADGQSLLQKTFLRAAALSDVHEVLTVTNRELYFKTEDEYRLVNPTKLPTSFVLEPNGRNTAPAIAAAALHASKLYGADATLLVLSADHLIANQATFNEAVEKAKALAQQGMLVTFGIQPSAPETGYGYIEANGVKVMRFVEKPSLDKAKEYIASGRFLWNAGIFCFRADVILAELEKLAPELIASSKSCFELSRSSQGRGFAQIELDLELFQKVPDISIDYAVMEKSDRVAVVACDIGWSDIGSWNAISELEVAEEKGNRVVGEAMMYDTSGCYIQSYERMVGTVGVENLIIIDTPDALLVADKARAQDVKHIVGLLKKDGHDAYKLHKEVHRPWGTYTVLEEGTHFKIKRIEVKPGASLSLQMHHHRSEHWIVVNGMAKVVNGQQELFIQTNESTYIPAGHKHRLENPGMLPLVMIEVQSGEYLGEDDIVRFDDVYGRVKA